MLRVKLLLYSIAILGPIAAVFLLYFDLSVVPYLITISLAETLSKVLAKA
jgi:hypothetical protein